MESVYGMDAPAAIAGEAALVDPAKVAAVKAGVLDLQAHVSARVAQRPDIQDEAKDLIGILKSLAKRFDEEALGVSVVGHVTESEARLVDGLVRKLSNGRDHMELSYLRELSDTLTFAVLALAV